MKELTDIVKDFELTTGAFLKYYCTLGIKCFYDVIENTWDGKKYKDLVLYVTTPNSKDMYKANAAKQKIVSELTNTKKCFMGEYYNYEHYADIIKNHNCICLRKYEKHEELY